MAFDQSGHKTDAVDSRQIAEYTFNIFEVFTLATVLYMLVTLIVTIIMRFVEAKVRIPGTIALGGD